MTDALFQLEPCERCAGRGRVRDYDGENQDCDACDGTGFRYPACRVCGDPANSTGVYCVRHDPETADLPL